MASNCFAVVIPAFVETYSIRPYERLCFSNQNLLHFTQVVPIRTEVHDRAIRNNHMKFATLQRWGGIAIILGSVFFTAWAICWTTLLPVHERARDVSLMILNPHWIWIASLALPGIVLMIFGYTAVYSRLYNKTGILGFVGYVFIMLAYIFQAAKVTWEIFVYPIIVSYAPSVSLFSDKIFMQHPQFILFRWIASATIFIGVILFCITLIKSREFPKSAGILILCGAVIYALGPMINIYLAIAGVLILSLGCFILGYKMIFTVKE